MGKFYNTECSIFSLFKSNGLRSKPLNISFMPLLLLYVVFLSACQNDTQSQQHNSNDLLGGVKPEHSFMPNQNGLGYQPDERIAFVEADVVTLNDADILVSESSSIEAELLDTDSPIFTSIQSAINASSDDDTIFVTSGFYQETELNIQHSIRLVAEKNTTLHVANIIIEGSENSFLDVEINGFNMTAIGGMKPQFFQVFGETSHIMFKNNHINNTSSAYSFAIKVGSEQAIEQHHSFVEISGNIIEGFNSWAFIEINATEETLIEHNEFIDNGGPVVIRGQSFLISKAVVKNNLLFYYPESLLNELSWAGIEVNQTERLELIANTIHGVNTQSLDGSSHALQTWNDLSWTAIIQRNDFSGNRQGAWFAQVENLQSDSLIENNNWPDVVSSDNFVIRTNTNRLFSEAVDTWFYESDEAMMAALFNL